MNRKERDLSRQWDLVIDLVTNAGRWTDEELGELKGELLELEGGVKTGNTDTEFVVGEGSVVKNLVLIMGVDRGLWDEYGYPHSIGELDDGEFGNLVQFKVATLMRNEMHEAIYGEWIEILLLLRHGIRKIDLDQLKVLFRLVHYDWDGENMVSELYDLRLKTIRLALRAVINQRTQNGHF